MFAHRAPEPALAIVPQHITAQSLVRTIGRWSLAAAIVNAVIGSGVFGLPATIAGLTGAWSPLVVMLAGLALVPVVLCFAEVGSRFDRTGGAYLYTRTAFGPVVGFHVGWMILWSRLFSGGAVLNVLTTYLAPLMPWVGTRGGRATVMVVAIALVTGLNVRGVRQTTWTVNVFTVAKLLPLVLLAALGLTRLDATMLEAPPVVASRWTEAALLLVFAYGGFEVAVIAAGETRRPREDTAFALIVAMLLVALVYATVQLAAEALLPDAAASKAPVADALGAALGAGGAVLGSVAAVVSASGWLAGTALLVPRIPFAMAERGELPAALARIHPTFRTPATSIVLCSAVALALGLYGSFAFAATFSAIARLVVYGTTCAALPRLRKLAAAGTHEELSSRPGFALPGGTALALLGVALTLVLLATRTLTQAWVLAAIVAMGAAVRHVSAPRH